VLLLAGCGDPGAPAGPATGDGGGAADGPHGQWILADGVEMVEGYPITMDVADGQVGGTAACNSYGGAVRVDGETFEVGDVSRTAMGCPDEGVHDSESAYLDALMAVDRHERDAEQLVLTGPDIQLRFDPVAPEEDAALTGTEWRLESLLSGGGPDGTASSTMAEATLRLDDDGSFAANDGCNTLDGRWALDGDVLRLDAVTTTDMACPDVAQQTEQVATVLQGEPTVAHEGRRLTLTAGELGLDFRAE
jgi:heat shock protein HslJ